GKACDVYLTKGGTVAYATLGATSAAIALGAGLIADAANPGYLVPSESSPIAIAWQAVTGAHGSIINVLFLYSELNHRPKSPSSQFGRPTTMDNTVHSISR